jgi:hypothetical protein
MDEGASGADEIVVEDDGRARDLAHQATEPELAATACLFEKRERGLLAECGFQGVLEALGALHTAHIRRDHRHGRFAQPGHECRREELARLEMDGRHAEGVVEGGRVVDLEGEQAVNAARLEELRGVAQGHGIVRLGTAIFACIGEVRQHRGHAGRAVVLEAGEEVQESHEPVVDAGARIAAKRLDHVDLAVADRFEGAQLVFAVLEEAFFVRPERHLERTRDRLAERACRFEGKEYQAGSRPHAAHCNAPAARARAAGACG